MSKQEDAEDTRSVPVHLPKKLSINPWSWTWITTAVPGRPYSDLEGCLRGAKERGFNAVRAEAGLNWAFRLDGTPRGPVTFGPPIARGPSADTRNDVRLNALDRVVRLLELAQQHQMWVILTSWEYQDSTSFVVDPQIREEVFGIALERRFMHLAEQYDRLLDVVESSGLDRPIAFVEVHNEPEYSQLPKGEEGKRLHREAIAFLRARHPNVLVSGDFASHDYSIIPDNVQVLCEHMYSGAGWYFDLYGRTVLSKEFDPHNPRALKALDRVLRDDFIPWDEFQAKVGNLREFWRPLSWLNNNVDIAKWDAWLAEDFPKWKDRIWADAHKRFAEDAAGARRLGVPLVLDEGGYFIPGKSRFEVTPLGLSLFELFADLAVKHGYWGFMPTTYCGPEHMIWAEDPDWLQRVNRRFQEGKAGGA